MYKHSSGPRVVTPPSLYQTDGRASPLKSSQILQSNLHAASYAWNGWRSAVMDEMQGLEQLHDDLTGRCDWANGDTPIKSSSQIVGAPVNSTCIVTSSSDAAAAASTTSTDAPSETDTNAPYTTADAVWASMLVSVSLTVGQLALSAASRLGLKPAMLARLTRTTAPSQATQSNLTAPKQTTQSNLVSSSQTTQLVRPTHSNKEGSSSHNSTNTTMQQSNMPSTLSSSSVMSNPVKSSSQINANPVKSSSQINANPVKSSSQINANPVESSSQIGLDRLGQAVVVRPEGVIYALTHDPSFPPHMTLIESTIRDGIDIDDSPSPFQTQTHLISHTRLHTLNISYISHSLTFALIGSTLRDGIDIDDSSVICRLHHRQIVYFDRIVVVRQHMHAILSTHIHPVNALCQYIVSIHCVNTLFPHHSTSSSNRVFRSICRGTSAHTYPANTPCKRTLSMNPTNKHTQSVSTLLATLLHDYLSYLVHVSQSFHLPRLSVCHIISSHIKSCPLLPFVSSQVPPIENETIAVIRLHVLYAVDASPGTIISVPGQGPGLGQGLTDNGQGLGQGLVSSLDGWVSLAGRIPEEDVAPILQVLLLDHIIRVYY